MTTGSARDLFAAMVCLSDGFLTTTRSRIAPAGKAERFFTIAAELPMDLQMLLSQRACGSGRDVISVDEFNCGYEKLMVCPVCADAAACNVLDEFNRTGGEAELNVDCNWTYFYTTWHVDVILRQSGRMQEQRIGKLIELDVICAEDYLRSDNPWWRLALSVFY